MEATKVPEKNPPEMPPVGHNRQPIKLPAGLSKLENLVRLSEAKKDLMKNSQFYSLLKIRNHRESAAGLIAALALRFDEEEKNFKLNEKTAVSFCFHDVAKILGIKDTGYDFNHNKSSDEILDTREDTGEANQAKFPDTLRNLRYQLLGITSDKQFSTKVIHEILTKMTIEGENALLFRQLVCYYVIEQLLMPASNYKQLRVSYWRHVSNLETFEKVNWAKAIFEYLIDGFTKMKTALLSDSNMKHQHVFAGFAPIVETWFFEKVKSFVPGTFTMDPPLVQKYKARRLKYEEWRFEHICIDKWAPCSLCTSPSITLPPSQVSTPRSLVTPHTLPRSLVTPHTPREAPVTPHSPPRSPVTPHSPFEPINEGFSPPSSSMLDQVIQDVENMLVSPPPKVQEDRTRAGNQDKSGINCPERDGIVEGASANAQKLVVDCAPEDKTEGDNETLNEKMLEFQNVKPEFEEIRDQVYTGDMLQGDKTHEVDKENNFKLFQKKCRKRLAKLKQKQDEEIKEFNRYWEVRRLEIEKKQKVELTIYRDKLKTLDDECAKKLEEIERQEEVSFRQLKAQHRDALSDENMKVNKWLELLTPVVTEDGFQNVPVHPSGIRNEVGASSPVCNQVEVSALQVSCAEKVSNVEQPQLEIATVSHSGHSPTETGDLTY